MDVYLVTLAFGALAVGAALLTLARLIPDDYDRSLPTRAVVVARSRREPLRR
jgi:hypothetical protein